MQLKGIHLQQGLESSRTHAAEFRLVHQEHTRASSMIYVSEHDVEMHSGKGA